eukprot:TRINITY_DN2939_c0_g1_i2.p1 TRINITY_DN2939_c0_g1~~TRINITY_DN2939_c0_g1_i2.p1  ORF type:complete len:426 (-),score=134.30 TRINITY_DN2939_c0_g1_i2:1182-2459(-)
MSSGGVAAVVVVVSPNVRPAGSFANAAASANMIEVLCQFAGSNRSGAVEFVRVDPKDVDLVPGDIVRLVNRQVVPDADMIPLETSGEQRELYIETSQIDGDKDLKFRKSVPVELPLLKAMREQGAGEMSVLQFESAFAEIKEGYDLYHVSVPETQPIETEKFVGTCLTNGNDLNYQHIVFGRSSVVLTEIAVLMVIYTKEKIRFNLIGGTEGAKKLAEEKKMKEKQRQKENEEKTKIREAEESKKIDPVWLKESTGTDWNPFWTNVPDDGNCLLHAFFLGLRALLLQRPDLASDHDMQASTPEGFREEFYSRLKVDQRYRQSLLSTFQLYVEGIDEAFLLSMEDFFTLPEELRNRILEIKSLMNQVPADSFFVNYEELVDCYVDQLATPQILNGKVFYLPLGEIEIMALARVYQTTIQVLPCCCF